MTCEYIGLRPRFFKGCCPSEYFDERGAFDGNYEMPCQTVPDAGHTMCPRHEFITAHCAPVPRYGCTACKATYVKPLEVGLMVNGKCHCGEGHVVEIPCERPL